MSKSSKLIEAFSDVRHNNRRPRAVRVFLASAIGLVPTVANAHDSSFPHVHPHGMGTVTILFGVIAIGLVVGHLYRRSL